jgi:hypothetical protein
MNHNLLFYITLLLSISPSAKTHCMDTSNGRICSFDMLMLNHFVETKNYATIEKEINEHQFTQQVLHNMCGMKQYHTLPNAYKIEHICSIQDKSELSVAVFNTIAKTKTKDQAVVVTNHANCFFNNPLGQCTSYEEIAWDENAVRCISRFFNKEVLLAALQNLKNNHH